MKLLERLSKEELRELLGKCWITHDGMWFAHTLMESGMDTANRLNRQAIRGMAAIELKRFMKLLAVTKEELHDFDRFQDFFSQVAELLIPDFMNVAIAYPEPNRVSWEFNDRGCFAFNGMTLLGVEKEYRCGVVYRIQCWLEVLEIPYRMEPEIAGCLMADTGKCGGKFTLWPGEGS
jgi:hypothetical protein